MEDCLLCKPSCDELSLQIFRRPSSNICVTVVIGDFGLNFQSFRKDFNRQKISSTVNTPTWWKFWSEFLSQQPNVSIAKTVCAKNGGLIIFRQKGPIVNYSLGLTVLSRRS